MNRRNSYRGIPLGRQFVRPNDDEAAPLFRGIELHSHAGARARKIFVVKQTRGSRTPNAGNKKLRRILIFDDHPDSLRLVAAEYRANATPHSYAHRHGNSQQLFITGFMLAMAAIGVTLWLLWPLF